MADRRRQNSIASSQFTVSTGWRLVSLPTTFFTSTSRAFASVSGSGGLKVETSTCFSVKALGLMPMAFWYSPCVTGYIPR